MVDNMLDWKCRGKTVEELIEELNSFEDQSIKVELSFDGGTTSVPISIVGKKDGKCLLISVVAEE
ncbi:hypothetical protein [Pseudomonas sp. dw_612]|uniref:hypothetical protein n=1 Tax=Pseudomonas sp. dw_612 TaxID=2720080 RepID=UPI001BD61169|nr:hypothetical protein [Pseudomonas sp. dw_612]